MIQFLKNIESTAAMFFTAQFLSIMAIWVVEFKNGGYKIKKVFAQESTSLMEIIEFWELD